MTKDTPESLGNGAAAKNTSIAGELEKMIPQSSSNAVSYSVNDASQRRFEMIFKGSVLNALTLQELLTGGTVTTLDELIQNTESIIDWNSSEAYGYKIYELLFPNYPQTQHWEISKWNIEELEDGIHILFKIEFTLHTISEDSSEDTPLEIHWTLTMAEESVNVLAYCNNTPGGDATGSDGNTRSWRILEWASINGDNAQKSGFIFGQTVNSTLGQKLNDAEQAIAKYYNRNINPTFYYPVIQKIASYSGVPAIDISKVGLIQNPSNGCPYNTSNHSWRLTGINSDYNSATKMSTVTYQWTGAAKEPGWSVDFYGATSRWKIGGVTVANYSNVS